MQSSEFCVSFALVIKAYKNYANVSPPVSIVFQLTNNTTFIPRADYHKGLIPLSMPWEVFAIHLLAAAFSLPPVVESFPRMLSERTTAAGRILFPCSASCSNQILERRF
jgi:hypothetical protein